MPLLTDSPPVSGAHTPVELGLSAGATTAKASAAGSLERARLEDDD